MKFFSTAENDVTPYNLMFRAFLTIECAALFISISGIFTKEDSA